MGWVEEASEPASRRARLLVRGKRRRKWVLFAARGLLAADAAAGRGLFDDDGDVGGDEGG